MVTKEEFGQLISEFESFKDFMSDELEKIKNDLENLQEDLNDLKGELANSGKVIIKKKIG